LTVAAVNVHVVSVMTKKTASEDAEGTVEPQVMD